jgi:polyketide synthase PksJ
LNSPDIAIIGMAGRFPGARNVDEYWENLCGALEARSEFTEDELLAAGVSPELLADPNYVRARFALSDGDAFDAAFFGVTPREAELTDPQFRLFTETAWEAVEHAGYDVRRVSGPVGLFAGAGFSSYLSNLVSAGIAAEDMSFKNEADYLTTFVSFKLGLTGPSVAVQTFCSSSLVALHLACQSLLSGECDMALAGGVSLGVPTRTGYLYQEGNIQSPDGHCRAFDARAAGTVFGDGVGVAVLKRLDDALAEGDTIHAVIKGSAINNDGAGKSSYTAPSAQAQTEVVVLAQAVAGVEPRSIGYVEAHGTGTHLGDPIEIAALTRAFREGTADRGFCGIGSVKTSIGHLDRAAGISSLIKTVLALKHGRIPPSLHFETPNPEIRFEETPFHVVSRLADWPRGEWPRRAGVTALGIGGTNAHVVLEEAPAPEPSTPVEGPQLLVLSARTDEALGRASANLAAHLRRHPEANLADVAYTLQAGRAEFGHRRFVVAETVAEAASLLESDGVSTARNGDPASTRLEAIGREWAGGASVDWTALREGAVRRRVDLPTYPFERTRYWIDARVQGARAGAPRSSRVERKTDLSDWFSVPSWTRGEPLPDIDSVSPAGPQRWLVLRDRGTIGAALADRLRALGHAVEIIDRGDRFGRGEGGSYVLNPDRPEEYRAVLQELQGRGFRPDRVVSAWPLDTESDGGFRAFHQLVSLAQALGAQGGFHPALIDVLTRGAHEVTGDEDLYPERSTLLGPLKVIPQEYPHLRCRSVDLPPGEAPALADRVAALLHQPADEPAVALRGGYPWHPSLRAIPLGPAEGAGRLRDGGTYLITGGLGEIGLAIAGALAEDVRARLVLVGRSALAPREEWTSIVANGGTDEGLGRRIARLMELEAKGAEVLYAAADVADRQQMAAVVADAEARFGAIHGVVHGAGIVGPGSVVALKDTNRAQVEEHFRAKAHGAMVLDEVLGERTVDFVLLLSSLSSVLGGLGYTAYSAANQFLDAFAQAQHRRGRTAWISVNWDSWRFRGETPGGPWGASLTDLSMTAAEGVEAFRRIVAARRRPQVMVSTGDLDGRLDQWVRGDLARGSAPGDESASGAEQAWADVRGHVAGVWSAVLGLESAEPDENFFGLGGDSLVAMKLISRLRRTFGVDLPLEPFFQNPTVAGLEKMVEKARATGAVAGATPQRVSRDAYRVNLAALTSSKG